MLIQKNVNLKCKALDKVTTPFGEALKQCNDSILEEIYEGLKEKEKF